MLHSGQVPPPSHHKSPLAQWIQRAIGHKGVSVQFQLQGNHLHLLCESTPYPHRLLLLNKLIPALVQTDLNTLLPPDYPPIYQVVLYGRTSGTDRAAWAARIHLNQIDRHLEQLQQFQAEEGGHSAPRQQAMNGPSSPVGTVAPPREPGGALLLTNRTQARLGDPDAIARYLSETISSFGIAVKVSVKTLPYQPTTANLLNPISLNASSNKRLWVFCSSAYSPDPFLVGEPIAQQLRDLQLEGFRDAVIQIQVTGEPEPDWILRVDLTPTQEMLREWARWGDRAAITRLMNQALGDQGLHLSTVSLKDATLHLFCVVSEQPEGSHRVPDRETTRAIAANLLESLGPQGIHGAAVYGQGANREIPTWVEWLSLPAAEHPALAESVPALARQGDWGAITFLLTRLLNPDLDKYLATGGIRLQLLLKHDLLHVMTDAPVCPDQQEVSRLVVKFFKQLRLPQVLGVRMYGRRAGQKRPLWSHAADFVSRQRLVPEAVPEFAAAATYVNELIAEPGESILRPDLTPEDLHNVWNGFKRRVAQGIQSLLAGSQLFVPMAEGGDRPGTSTPSTPATTAVALIWGMAGLLLTVQVNWVLHQWVQHPPQSAEATTSPTTQTNSSSLISPLSASSPLGSVISESPLLQPLDPIESPLPTFSNPQLDTKLALYYQRLETAGPPDVLVVGSSRALRGVDPVALKSYLAELGYADVTVFNLGINGATAQVVDLIVRYLLPANQLPRLILWADGARAFNSGTPDLTYEGIRASEGYRQLQAGTLNIPHLGNPDATGSSTPIDLGLTLTTSYQAIDQWLSDRLAQVAPLHQERDRLKDLLRTQVTTRLPEDPSAPSTDAATEAALTPADALTVNQGMMDANGFLPLSLRFNPATYYQQYARVAGAYDSDYEDYQIGGKQEVALNTLLQFTRSQDIPVVFVNLPLTDDYLDFTRLQYEQEFKQYMLGLAVNQQGIIFRDLSDRWATRYDYFSDPSHLNRYGAYEVSSYLAQDPMIPWFKPAETGNEVSGVQGVQGAVPPAWGSTPTPRTSPQ